MEYVEPFEIACLQTASRQIPVDPKAKDEAIGHNIARILELIGYATKQGKTGVRIVVLPEYAINGIWEERPLEQFLDLGVTIPGKWTDLLAEKCRECNVYLAANMFEVDPEWPGRFFNTSFIIDPSGEIVQKHWKTYHNSNLFAYTTPADVYDAFNRKYGREKIHEVIKTPYGNLTTLTCAEVMFPETSRASAFNGAEIILHPTSEFDGHETANWNALKTTRAFENNLVFASANIGEFLEAGRGRFSSRGNSMIVAHNGSTLASLANNGEATTSAVVDLNALRYARSRAFNPALVRNEMMADFYRDAIGWRNNQFAGEPIESIQQTRAISAAIAREYVDRGLFELPERSPAKEPVRRKTKG